MINRCAFGSFGLTVLSGKRRETFISNKFSFIGLYLQLISSHNLYELWPKISWVALGRVIKSHLLSFEIVSTPSPYRAWHGIGLCPFPVSSFRHTPFSWVHHQFVSPHGLKPPILRPKGGRLLEFLPHHCLLTHRVSPNVILEAFYLLTLYLSI